MLSLRHVQSLSDPAHWILRGGGRMGIQDPHLVRRDTSAALRLGRHVEGQRRMGTGLFRADDELQ